MVVSDLQLFELQYSDVSRNFQGGGGEGRDKNVPKINENMPLHKCPKLASEGTFYTLQIL